MDSSSRPNSHWPNVGTGIWTRWWGYLARWLIFGVVVSVFQPVAGDFQHVWTQKAYQAFVGLLFGFCCAVVFTVVENLFNTPRVKWKTWLIVALTWLAVKTAFVTTISLT